jgi:hypothetical protein
MWPATTSALRVTSGSPIRSQIFLIRRAIRAAEHALAGAGLARNGQGQALLADQVALVHVQHGRELFVRAAIERGEGVNVAVEGLVDRGPHGTRTPHERAHLLEVRGELNIVQGGRVVRVRCDDAEHVRSDVVQDRKDQLAFGQLLGHLVQRQSIDVRLGQLLRRYEAGFVERSQVLEEGHLLQEFEVEQRLLHPLTATLHIAVGGLLLFRGQEPIGHQTFEKPRTASVGHREAQEYSGSLTVPAGFRTRRSGPKTRITRHLPSEGPNRPPGL